ncbi:hypothetical protein ACU686_12635 [Yinghuangia aomiensis]
MTTTATSSAGRAGTPAQQRGERNHHPGLRPTARGHAGGGPEHQSQPCADGEQLRAAPEAGAGRVLPVGRLVPGLDGAVVLVVRVERVGVGRAAAHLAFGVGRGVDRVALGARPRQPLAAVARVVVRRVLRPARAAPRALFLLGRGKFVEVGHGDGSPHPGRQASGQSLRCVRADAAPPRP